MKHKLMISYSRRQTPFVDFLADDLEDEGYSLWLDYQNLVPARPWHEQIEAGVSGADILLLVVSKASLLSGNVESEWRLALHHNKRIILVIFEAVPLPPELLSVEWVDFRTNHRKGMKKLKEIMGDTPREPKSPAPQSGFKAHPSFWLAVILSCIVLVLSIPAWWTFFIPYLLLPLPRQIHHRNYTFTRITIALLFLPVLILLTFVPLFISYINVSIYLGMSNVKPGEILFDPQVYNYLRIYVLIVLSASWLLLGLLFTPAMQRRALPEAARVRFANPLIPDVSQPRPVSIAIDSAPEDGPFAEDLRTELESFGHHIAPSAELAEAVFVLISTYKTGTGYDPDRQAVYPILLQDVGDMDEKLERIQWIDFRKGMRNARKLARLLPDPQRLLKALAIPPTGSQEIFPLVVNVLQYFYLITAMMGGGSLLLTVYAVMDAVSRFEFGREEFWNLSGRDIVQVILLLGVFLPGLVLYSLRGLRSRRGGTAAVYPLLTLTLLQVILFLATFTSIQLKLDALPGGMLEQVENIGVGAAVSMSMFTVFMFMTIAYLILLLITTTFLIVRRSEIYRWLPRRQPGTPVGIVENALLLFTPLKLQALSLHIVFHTVLAFLLISIILGGAESVEPCLLFIAIGIRGLAFRVSK